LQQLPAAVAMVKLEHAARQARRVNPAHLVLQDFKASLVSLDPKVRPDRKAAQGPRVKQEILESSLSVMGLRPRVQVQAKWRQWIFQEMAKKQPFQEAITTTTLTTTHSLSWLQGTLK
jgi:hypothetical protein